MFPEQVLIHRNAQYVPKSWKKLIQLLLIMQLQSNVPSQPDCYIGTDKNYRISFVSIKTPQAKYKKIQKNKTIVH